MEFLISVVMLVCVNFVSCEKNVYKAAVIGSNEDFTRFTDVIIEAGKLNVDILVLPSGKAVTEDSFEETDDYDEFTKSISNAARTAGVYVVTHVLEQTRCQNREETIRSNLVFDRQGAIVSVYRKPINPLANCTKTTEIPRFTTDFGVTFGLLMEDGLVLQKPGNLQLKNFVVAGDFQTDILFLTGSQFASSWAYIANANLVTSTGVYLGKTDVKSGSERIVVAKINKSGPMGQSNWSFSKQNSFPEDLSHYIIRPLDLEDTKRGYKETLCHGQFCCDFSVKTGFIGSSTAEASYGLAIYSGSRHFSNYNIATQSCALVCAGLYKRTGCGSNNSTNTIFEKITISGNFAEANTAQFPIFISSSDIQDLKFDSITSKTNKKVTITVANAKNLFSIGIFGRNYNKDFVEVFDERKSTKEDSSDTNYDYFFNEDVKEYFDYLWIRLRVLIFIVSIYVLEML